ncbi:glutathione-dependent formaldehyde-activating enzyme [Microthyrium microscopicum]|uniref:Glutathione-dependent formaldehyde-activating enzyme n=1 Tax=Microthyrium microscopicum TaxID=703497 RepID=A0A6A6U061_9PEZI|nr:glutathione-dependent formaldehyde-activating enzyme [Microthyrium microscopicum]
MTSSTPPSPFTPLEGGCACGKVRYRLEVEPFAVHACHCRHCQKESGSAYQLNYGIETANITFTTPKENLIVVMKPSETGEGLPMARCATCYICIYHQNPIMGPAGSFVKVGTLDEIPSWIRPISHLFVRSKLPFVVIPEDVKTWQTFPESMDYYPEESARRMVALMPEIHKTINDLKSG